MEDAFKPQNLTISALFGNTDARYQIPHYQRPYKWGDDQVEKLWDDLWDAFTNNEPNYFLGSVITAKPEGGNHYLDIVDGQQRTTTLMILFCTCRDLYPEINENSSDPVPVDINTLTSSIQQNNRTDRLRLHTHSNHQSDFKKMILEAGATLHATKPTKKQLSLDEEPRYKFQNTASIFRHKFQELGIERSGEFLNYIFNRVQIIRIDCTSVGFAIKLFQVLNDRGLDLTNSDLIKSYLLDRLYKKNVDDAAAKQLLENQFMDDWKSCEGIANSTDFPLNSLFVLYQYYVIAQNPKKSLSEELQERFKDEDPNNVIADIKAFCQTYKKDFHDTKDKTISSLWYLPWSFFWRAILLTAKHTGYKDFDELKRLVHRFYYLYWIAGDTLARIKFFSFGLIKYVKDQKDIKLIEQEMEEKLEDDKVIERACEELISPNLYYQRWCKSLLFTIEYNGTDTNNTEFLAMEDRNIQVEHILPKSYHSVKGWEHIDENTALKWLDSGGNLTLLSGKKNIEASNNPFAEKISIYAGKGKYGDGDTKVTAFQMTQKIVNEYKQGKFERWDEKSMESRRKWFIKNVEEIFSIKIKQ